MLCFSNGKGAIAAGLLQPEHFEPPYRDIASKVLEFRTRFKEPPGEAHIDDLFDSVLNDPKRKDQDIYRLILAAMLDQHKGLNEDYVLSRVTGFIRKQNMKTALLKAGERLLNSRDDEDSVSDAEGILYSALREKVVAQDYGIFLNDPSNIASMLKVSEKPYRTAIHELDNRNIGLTPKELLLFIAPKGFGKSWFAVHLGREALMQSANVVHISLEMSAYKVAGRYYQSLFGIAKRKGTFETIKMEVDNLHRFKGFTKQTVTPEASLSDDSIGHFLKRKLTKLGNRLGGLVIKQFPTDGCTTAMLSAFLDGLELRYGFVPNVLLVDYPDLMRMDSRQELRLAIGKVYKELRGLAIERNLALGAPTQAGRKGMDARVVSSTHIAEDFSKNQTADMVLTGSRTREEKRLNMARLLVAHNRDDEDGFTVLIRQQYATGQFVLESARMTGNYFDTVRDEAGNPEAEEGDPAETGDT